MRTLIEAIVFAKRELERASMHGDPTATVTVEELQVLLDAVTATVTVEELQVLLDAVHRPADPGLGWMRVPTQSEHEIDVGKCSQCGSEVLWVRMASGKAMPCNPKLLKVVTDAGNVVSGRESHFATCPAAAKMRKPAAPEVG